MRYKKIVIATEAHRPIDDAARGPEDGGDTEARTQFALLQQLSVFAAEFVGNAASGGPEERTRLDQSLRVLLRPLIDGDFAVLGQLEVGRGRAAADCDRERQQARCTFEFHSFSFLVVMPEAQAVPREAGGNIPEPITIAKTGCYMSYKPAGVR